MFRRAVLASILLASSAKTQEVGVADSSFADGILVTTHDVTTCPYRTIDTIHTSASVEFSSTQRMVMFSKLRAKAAKLNADAVIMVNISSKRVTAFSFGKRDAIGRAIQYVDKACAPKS